ncbi:MAG: glycosyl transferase, partial [Ruminiclostridium sp.]|nr:glycosyl transferase [Ruminiclostridium sp.]
MNVLKRFLYKAEHLLIYLMSPLSPALASKIMYFAHFKKPLDLKSPETLNEKLMWLKLNVYTNNRLVSDCTDKYNVREYVNSAGCGDILNTLIGAWDRPEDIP